MGMNDWKDTAPIYTLVVKTRGGKWVIHLQDHSWDDIAKEGLRLHTKEKYPRSSIWILEAIHHKLPDFIK